MSAELELLEARLADVLRDPDPAAAWSRLAEEPGLSDDLRARLAAADLDGVRTAALIVVRLRFERAIHGSRHAAEWFERDPAGFADAFRRYHEQVRPTAALPSAEAELFERWCEAGRSREDGL